MIFQLSNSGQFTRLLVPYFNRVLGTDVSAAQVRQARQALPSTVELAVSPAETLTGVADRSVALLSVCQALHWLQVRNINKQLNKRKFRWRISTER